MPALPSTLCRCPGRRKLKVMARGCCRGGGEGVGRRFEREIDGVENCREYRGEGREGEEEIGRLDMHVVIT